MVTRMIAESWKHFSTILKLETVKFKRDLFYITSGKDQMSQIY